MKKNDIRAEILAPAGSYESFMAAINAKADAVYLGGDMFGARAYANNFGKEELIRAIDYAHLHNAKVYMTVNTLFDNDELYNKLYDYLLPYYKEGLDAVIVQDLGAFEFIRQTFKDLPIHASTQMTVCNKDSAKILKDAGASRVVTARELSLKEIRDIHDNVDIEIESFVHGALCYCYSGQCLMSSFIGGRSGNRGRCAQPCRLPYTYGNDKKYFLSPKDLNALSILPEVLEAGVYSLKIEGRMKKPWYTAGVVTAYRKYLDYYYEHGKDGYKVTHEDMNMLMDLYNRGGFTKGYYLAHNGKNMMSIKRPNHQGVEVGNIISDDKRQVKIKLTKDINEGDVLEICQTPDEKIEWTQKTREKSNATITVKNSLRKKLADNKVYRTRNNKLIEEIEDKIKNTVLKEKINGNLTLLKNEEAVFTVWYEDVCVTKQGQVVDKANNQPMDKEKILKQMNKMGNTPFEFDTLDITMDNDIFIPVGALNELRRSAIEALEVEILKKFKREEVTNVTKYKENTTKEVTSCKINVCIENKEHLDIVLTKKEISRVILDMGVINATLNELKDMLLKIKEHKKEAYIQLPHIFRENAKKDAKEIITYADGVIIKNIDELAFVNYLDYKGGVVGDYSLYAYNNMAYEFYSKNKVSEYTLPVELNYKNLRTLDNTLKKEIICYGYQITMVSAQCIVNTTSGCTKKMGILKLKDRMNNEFVVRNNCKYCYNTIYNALPTNLISNACEIKKIGVESVRVNLTIEDKDMASRIIDDAINSFCYNMQIDNQGEFTRGHFKRGVE